MMGSALSERYWDARYAAGQMGWDLGGANTGLVAAVALRVPPDARILIPGAGLAHEAQALWALGYRDTYVLDWSAEAIARARGEVVLAEAGLTEGELDERLITGDFFTHGGRYDVFVEQTFFCAIDPARRAAYVEQAAAVLTPGGLWIGLLFDRVFPSPGPPFGGSRPEYERLFAARFDLDTFGPSELSVGPRRGSELFGVFRRR